MEYFISVAVPLSRRDYNSRQNGRRVANGWAKHAVGGQWSKYNPSPLQSIYLIDFLAGSILILPRNLRLYMCSRHPFIWTRCPIRYTHSSARLARYAAVIQSILTIITSEILSAFIGSCTDTVYTYWRIRSLNCLQSSRLASLTHLQTVVLLL